jgi:ectoine hydroxylase-related dioxygenase (phytanoyl-CoA dioxygenase family)
MSKMTQERKEFYDREGYVVIPDLFPQSMVAELGAIVDELLLEAAKLDKSNAHYDLEPSHTSAEPRVRRLKDVRKLHQKFDDLGKSPEVLDALQALIGPDIRYSHTNVKINIKGAQYGSPVEWHQDWAGYPHTNDDLLSVGVPLDDCALENGPLLVLPGSHTGELYSHHNSAGVYCTTIDPTINKLPFSDAVPLTGKRGMATFHHARIVHGSALNTSTRPRRLLIYQYAAADAWPLMGVTDIATYDAAMLRGQSTLQPRMKALPIRIPRPLAPDFDGLYTSQAGAKNRFFTTYEQSLQAEQKE